MNSFTKLLIWLMTALSGYALTIGDPAPALKVGKWIKGEPLEGLDPEKTYVVECWATWCGPCRASIPHLTEMAREFTNVTFIGVSVWERGPDVEQRVADFVARMGEQMDYAVALDTPDRFVATHWMDAAGQGGIPTAFVVHQGRIAWIGHPRVGLEPVLRQISQGSFDLDKTAKRLVGEKKLREFFEKVATGAADAELVEQARALETLDAEVGGLLPSGKPFVADEFIRHARFEAALRAYAEALRGNSPPEEIAPLEEAARAAAPEGVNFEEIKQRVVESIREQRETENVLRLFRKYMVAVRRSPPSKHAPELAAKLEEMNITNPQLLNNIAWAILTDEDVVHRDIAFATRLARRALELSKGESPQILDTYARALFEAGDVEGALEYQKKAAALAPDDPYFSEVLQKYEKAASRASQ